MVRAGAADSEFIIPHHTNRVTMGEERANLTLLAEKMSPSMIDPSHLSYCPAMDLLALAAQDERVHVFRLNGQRVFGVSKKDADSGVTCVQWNPNGNEYVVPWTVHYQAHL